MTSRHSDDRPRKGNHESTRGIEAENGQRKGRFALSSAMTRCLTLRHTHS